MAAEPFDFGALMFEKKRKRTKRPVNCPNMPATPSHCKPKGGGKKKKEENSGTVIANPHEY